VNKTRLPIVFMVLYVALSLLTLTASKAKAEPLAIRAGRLLEVETGEVLKDQLIFVENGRIKSIGNAVPVPASTRTIDLSRQTVLPGLIDCHTHLVGSVDADPIVELQKTSAQRALESIPNARATLEAGFTTVRDAGCYRALTDLALRDSIKRADLPGPRMFAAGAYLTISGGGGALGGFAPDIALPADLRYGEANDPWTVRKRVRELASRGADFIKIICTGAVLTHGSNPGAEEFTPEEMQACVDEAGKFGLKVVAHAHSARGIKDAVAAGVASIEHGTFLDAEGIELMKKHGTFLVADIYDDDYIQASGKGLPADFLEHNSELGRTQRLNFQAAVRQGVKIAFGTDAGVFPHGDNARQFPLMVKYGQTPMQALQSATIRAAELLGKAESLGSLKPGKYADIIAVDGDPLSNISLLERVSFVMKEGKIYKQTAGSVSENSASIIMNQRLYLKAGQESRLQEFRKALEDLATFSRGEKGNLAYELYEDVDRPGNFMIVEKWSTQSALDQHKTKAELKEFFEKYGDIFERKPTSWHSLP
jgi:imidazolonepropionase-like amidohydrolase/quinol monooxygenase YgiN